MSDTSEIKKCTKCGAANRVRRGVGWKQPVCGACKAPLLARATPVTVTDRNFADVVGESALPVLLDMWAAWCGPCRMVGPIVDGLAADLAGRVVVGKMDVDANQQTAARFGVQSIPTLLILKNGKEVSRIVGAQSREAILAQLARHIQ